MSKKMKALEDRMRRFALTFPEAKEGKSWDHISIKVRKKNFVFFGGHKDSDGLFSMTLKLPQSAEMAASLPFVESSGHGYGRSGWVTVRLGPKDKADPKMFEEWIEQSYRAVAPKKLVKAMDGG